MARLLLLSSLLCPAAATSSPLMDGFSRVFAEAAAAPHGNKLRPFLGHVAASVDALLRPIWDAAPAAARERAMELATRAPAAPYPNPLPGPAYRWIPELLGNALPGAAPLQWASPCFAVNSAEGAFEEGGAAYIVTVSSSSPSSGNCSDSYWLGTVEWMELLTNDASKGATTATALRFPITSRAAARAWVERKGALVMRFLDSDPLAIIWAVLGTVELFIPQLISSPLTPAGAEVNYQFLKDYVNITMEPRSIVNVTVDPSLIRSGDLLMIHRADGLATLEQWGTGATTSHVVSFIRSEATGELLTVESQSAGADWPIDRIQINKWEDWQAMAAVASYSYIWQPITDATAAAYNLTAAWEFVNATVGVNYGYQDFAVTFYDTEFDNLPWPARPEELEMLLGIVDGLLDGLISVEGVGLIDMLFTQTLVQHLGLKDFNMSFLEACEAGAAAGFTMGALLALPEQDTYRYPQATGVGPTSPSLVCDAYACAIHKAAGSFGALAADINCADFHNADVYQLDLFDPAPTRPAACVEADPMIPYCQLAGTHRLRLPKAGTVAPYAHMVEHCPSLPIAYAKNATC